MDAFRYGLFSLGQIWTLTDENGPILAFKDRDMAAASLQAIVAIHRASGSTVVVTVQGPNGQLQTLLNPVHDLALAEQTSDAAWSRAFQ